MNCFENITVPSCVWFEVGQKRNTIASIFAGLLFFAGWWFIIDAASVYPGELPNVSHVCGALATLSLVMINSVSNSQVHGDRYTGGYLSSRGARIWLFIGFVIGFASLIPAFGFLFANFVHAGTKHTWPRVCLFLQNALIFAGSLVLKCGRIQDTWG